MKRLWLAALLGALLCGCDAGTGYSNVQDAFPKGDVKNVPGHSYDYIVRLPDGTIYWAYSSGSGYTHVESNVLFHPLSK